MNGFQRCGVLACGILAAIALLAMASVSTSADAQTIDRQLDCAKRADRVAAAFGDNTDVQNHFNNKLGKCLVLVDHHGPASRSITLMDPVENRVYATLAGNVALDANTVTGMLSPHYGIDTMISSKAEFDAFVRKYLEE
jgi:hypothetical protein